MLVAAMWVETGGPFWFKLFLALMGAFFVSMTITIIVAAAAIKGGDMADWQIDQMFMPDEDGYVDEYERETDLS